MKTEPRLKILMLLRHLNLNIHVYPQIEIFAYLTNFGHHVTWISSLGEEYPREKLLFQGATVYNVPDKRYFPNNFLPTKIISFIPNFFKRIFYVLRIFSEGQYNLIYARNEPFDGLIAIYLKKRNKIPFIFELSSPLDQIWNAFRTEPRKPKFLHYLVVCFHNWILIRVMKQADLILTTTQRFEEELTKNGICKSRLMPYPNGVNIGLFSDRYTGNVRAKYNLANSKIIIYVGTIAKTRNLDMLIEAFAMVRHKHEKTKLLIVGSGSDIENLEELVTKLDIKGEVIFTGHVSHSKVRHMIAASDIGVSPVPPTTNYKVSSPIKMFEYMAMGKPVVANEEIFEHKEVLEQSGGGLLALYDKEAFAEAILKLLNDPKMAKEMGKMGRYWVKNNRTYEILSRNLEKRCFELVSCEGKSKQVG